MATTNQPQLQPNEHQDHGYDEQWLKSLTLEGISLEILKVLAYVEDFEDLPEGFEKRLTDLNLTLESKVYGIARFITHLKHEIDYLHKEEVALSAKRSVREGRLKKLEDYTINYLTELGQKTFDFVKFKVSIQKNPPSVIISDEKKIPKTFKSLSITEKVDKKAISTELKNGKEVPGCHLHESFHLRIG